MARAVPLQAVIVPAALKPAACVRAEQKVEARGPAGAEGGGARAGGGEAGGRNGAGARAEEGKYVPESWCGCFPVLRLGCLYHDRQPRPLYRKSCGSILSRRSDVSKDEQPALRFGTLALIRLLRQKHAAKGLSRGERI